MQFYLAGQTNFGNRGCEALVRSSIGLIAQQFPGASFMVPSFNPVLDARQWDGDENAQVHFVKPMSVPISVRWWNRLASRLPRATGWWEPIFTLPEPVASDITRCDALLMIGGDNISLDYGLGSLFLWSGLADAAARSGKKTILFAASVGPFDDNPEVERFMVNHLRRYSAITVRESESLRYLEKLGITNVELVADPAFSMVPEICPLPDFFASSSEGVLGLNVSPLIQALRDRSDHPADIAVEAAAFVDQVIASTGLAVALIPHVDPLDGSAQNSDSVFMSQIVQRVTADPARLMLLPRTYNAAQLKHVISHCRYFIGARTHATIAAWSSGVPTVSIAYSIKAKGLNKDLFDTLDYVLDTPKVDRASIWRAFAHLVAKENDIRALLAERIPQCRIRSVRSAEILKELMT